VAQTLDAARSGTDAGRPTHARPDYLARS
jgi:hypothetical protein